MRKENSFNPEQVWNEFYQKYPLTHSLKYHQRYNQKLSDSEIKAYQQAIQINAHKKQQSLDQFARKIQRYWRKKLSSDTLIPVNLNANHTEEFKELVNEQKVLKSINQTKLKQLFKSVQAGNWKDKIFMDPHLAYLALSLFDSNKITSVQIRTLLEYVQIAKEKKDIRIIEVLDKNLEFTEQFAEILKDIENLTFKRLEKKQLIMLKSLICHLPASERACFLFEINQYILEKQLMDENLLKHGQSEQSLGLSMLEVLHKTIIYDQTKPQLRANYITAGIRDALGIVRFGLKNYVRLLPTLGEKTPHQIESGIRKQVRYSVLDFPGTIPFTKIHEFNNVTLYEAIQHDYSHAEIMSILGWEVQQAILLLVDQLRALWGEDIKPTLGGKPLLSFELWTLIDAVFLYCYYHDLTYNTPFFRNNLLTEAKITEKFFLSLLHEENELGFSLFLARKNQSVEQNITLLGVILILFFLNNPTPWLAYKINFAKLTRHDEVENTENFEYYFREIKDLHKYIKVDSIKIQIFKVLLFQSFKIQKNGKDKFLNFSNMISRHHDKILTRLTFRKINKNFPFKDDSLRLNSVSLCFDNYPLFHDPNKNKTLIRNIKEEYKLPVADTRIDKNYYTLRSRLYY